MNRPSRVIVTSPARRKRDRERRKRQEARWAAKSGPVVVYFREPRRSSQNEQATNETTKQSR